MQRLFLFTVMLTAVFFATAIPANASPTEVLRDCADNGVLDKDYSIDDLNAAKRMIPEDLLNYSECEPVVDAAIVAKHGTPPALDNSPVDAPGQPFIPFDPQTRPELPDDLPLPNYGEWDLRRIPKPYDCGNLNSFYETFYTLATKKGIKAFNVKRNKKTSCTTAIFLIKDKRLRGYKKGKRYARGFNCSAKKTTNKSITPRRNGVRTITCKASKSRVIRWQVKV